MASSSKAQEHFISQEIYVYKQIDQKTKNPRLKGDTHPLVFHEKKQRYEHITYSLSTRKVCLYRLQNFGEVYSSLGDGKENFPF